MFNSLWKYFLIYRSDIVGIYDYGSRLYNTHTIDSDYDYVVVVDSNFELHDTVPIDTTDIHILSIKTYKRLLNECNIMALECYYQSEPMLKYECNFALDLTALRHSISKVSSNSWVKAKKKLRLDNEDNYIGYKSLFHSIRILMFGIQLASTNTIDYSSAKKLHDEMFENGYNEFEQLLTKYKPIHNELSTEFRKLAPKL